MGSFKSVNVDEVNPPQPISKPDVLRMELDCDFSQVRPVADQMQKFLEEHGCRPEARTDCELVLVEGCNNAIRHGHGQAARQPVIVEIQVDPNEIELRITDHGPGFNWPKTPSLPGPEKESGRGLYLMCALTDYAAYVRQSSENILVLRKKRCL